MVDKRPYLTLFTHLSEIVQSTQDLPNLLSASVEVIRTVLDVESCSVMLLDAETRQLTLEASTSIPASLWPTIRVELGDGVAGRVAKSGKPTIVSSRDTLPPSVAQTDTARAKKYRTSSFLSVPLQTSREIIGVVNVTDRVDRESFTQYDLEMLQAVAKSIAGTIENHRIWRSAMESRSRMSLAIDGLPIGMFTVDPHGRLTLCNRSASELLALGPTVPLDLSWEKVFREPVRSFIERSIQRKEESTSSYFEELEIPSAREEGSTKSVRISVVRTADLTSMGTPHFLFLVEDLQVVRELVELRRSDQMKSSFLSIISHELRTPLTSIKGGVILLEQMLGKDSPETVHRLFQVLNRNSDRLIRLVGNILDTMDIEAHTIHIAFEKADLHPLILRTVSDFETAGREKGIIWEMALDAANSVRSVDETRFSQVLQHLMENAVKFTHNNGTIRIVTTNNADNWILRVYNTGRAIAPAQTERLFTKFYQIDGSLTRDCGGSGLGLYLCREILRLHGGDIRVDTSYTEGACFVVNLPEVATVETE
jgi:PAS domain S-box-containing protein